VLLVVFILLFLIR